MPKSKCAHVFERRGISEDIGTYATCHLNLTHEKSLTAEWPNYVECVKCGVIACVHCAMTIPAHEDPWEEITECWFVDADFEKD